MNLRTAAPADLNRIAEIERECFPAAEAAGREAFAQRLRYYPEHFWVLEDQGRIVSFVNGMATDEENLSDRMYDHAELHQPEGKWQMIFGVDTIPQYRRQGCAALLLRHVIEEARAAGRLGLVLTCKERLVHYYASFGFVNEGISESTHGNVRWYQMRLRF